MFTRPLTGLLATGLLVMLIQSAARADETKAATPTVTAPADSANWPQWRGPNRDGIAPSSPKLLSAWPKDGPRLVWKSDPIPSGTKGGAGSVAVADGKAFVFVHSRKIIGKAMLTTKDLIGMGWAEGIPDDLAKKVDAAIRTDKWRKAAVGPAMDDYIKEFIATLDPKQAETYGPFVRNRMNEKGKWGKDYPEPLNWDGLCRLARIRDKEIPELENLRGFIGLGEHESVYDRAYQVARGQLNEKFAGYFDTVICLDAATGKELWRKEFPGNISRQMEYWGASSTPTVCDGKCYVTGSAGFYCLSVKDGAVVWQAKTEFSNSSPLVVNGVVYVGVPGATAYDAKTGAVIWSLPKLTMDSTSLVTWTHGGKDYLIGAVPGGTYTSPPCGAYCLDPATGKELWRAWNKGTVSTPVIRGDTMVLRGFAYKLSPEKAESLWSKECDGDAGSQIVYEGCVYHTGGHCFSPQLRCLDVATGATKWDLPGGAWQKEIRCSSPVLADGKIIAVACESAAIMFKASADKYEELGRFNPGVAACTSPAIAGGKLYLRLENGVACYDLAAANP